MSCSLNSWSETMVLVKARPVRSVAIDAMSAKDSACAPVSGGVGPSNRPSSARITAAASARSACAVQLAGPSAGSATLPVSSAWPRKCSALEA